MYCLNPCFNGIWSASRLTSGLHDEDLREVLILVLMEYGLRAYDDRKQDGLNDVLILVLMEYGLRASLLYSKP